MSEQGTQSTDENVAASRTRLGQALLTRLTQFKAERREAEEQWLRNQRQMNGVYDMQLPENRSKAYPRLTRVKSLSVLARIHAMMFPAGEPNWDVDYSPVPSLSAEVLTALVAQWMRENPNAKATQHDMDLLVKAEAERRVGKMRAVIRDQLADAGLHCSVDFSQLARDVMYDAIVYCPGILKGPMTIKDEKAILVVDDAGLPRVVAGDIFYRPYLEHVRPWDWFPDMSAKTLDGIDASFERHVYTKQTLRGLAERDDFFAPVINDYLTTNPGGNHTPSELDHAREDASRSGTRQARGSKFELYEFWGELEAEHVKACGVALPDNAGATVTATAWIVDGKLVKLAVSPFPAGESLYHTFVFERDDGSIMGAGLPQVMRDSQMMVANGARMLVDNAGAVCGPALEVDSMLLDDTRKVPAIEPFAVFYKDSSNALSGNGGRLVEPLSFDSHINELLAIIRQGTEFADTETFVSQMTGGQFDGVGEALRTNGNFSAALQAAALPYKDIVRNFDRFTKSLIGRMIRWNTIFHESRDDMSGDVRPVPKGASSLMAKEQRAMAIQAVMAAATPEERDWIKTEVLVQEKFQALDIPTTALRTPEEVAKIQADRAEQQKAELEMQRAMQQAQLNGLKTEALKDLTQSQKNSDLADAAMFRELVNAIKSGADIEHIRATIRQTERSPQPAPGNPPAADGGAIFPQGATQP